MEFYKEKKSDKVFWVDDPDRRGPICFSFDKKKIYNLWLDYPQNLSDEEKKIFDAENPFWVDFFHSK